MTSPALFDDSKYEESRPRWGSGPMPLWMFPREHREEIERLVALPEPPPKWLRGELVQMVSRAWLEWHRARGRDPYAEREPLPRSMRAAVIARDGYVCQLCGAPVEQSDVHIDHIIPFARGGRDTLDNLQVAHSLCNLRKGARL